MSNPVTTNELYELMTTMVLCNHPVLIEGQPGIGKTAMVSQLPSLLEIDLGLDKPVGLIDTRASQWDAVDSRGIPTTTDRDGNLVTIWAIPGLFPSEAEAAKYSYIIWFFDELPNATMSVQNALLQLFNERALGDYTLPENVRLFAAGNREQDRAGAGRFNSALRDRFFVVELLAEIAAWTEWALDNDIHPHVIAYLNWRPGSLMQFDPRSKEVTQTTPRGWEWLSDALTVMESRGSSPAAVRAMICGKVGNAIGEEFMSFRAIADKLPDVDDLIAGTAEVPSDPPVLYALALAVAAKAKPCIMDQITRVADEIGKRGNEFMMLLQHSISVSKPECCATGAFAVWAEKHQNLFK